MRKKKKHLFRSAVLYKKLSINWISLFLENNINFVERQKLSETLLFPRNFRTRKLGEILVFYAVIVVWSLLVFEVTLSSHPKKIQGKIKEHCFLNSVKVRGVIFK